MANESEVFVFLKLSLTDMHDISFLVVILENVLYLEQNNWEYSVLPGA